MVDKYSGCVDHRNWQPPGVVSTARQPVQHPKPPPIETSVFSQNAPKVARANVQRSSSRPPRQEVPWKPGWFHRFRANHPSLVFYGRIALFVGTLVLLIALFDSDSPSGEPWPDNIRIERGPVVTPGGSGGGGYCEGRAPFRVYGKSPYDRDGDGIACEK